MNNVRVKKGLIVVLVLFNTFIKTLDNGMDLENPQIGVRGWNSEGTGLWQGWGNWGGVTGMGGLVKSSLEEKLDQIRPGSKG